MNIIYADYNIYHNSIDICTYAGYILRIDCAKAEEGQLSHYKALDSFLKTKIQERNICCNDICSICRKIKLDTLLLIETSGRKLRYLMVDGKEYFCEGNISEVSKSLEQFGFFQVQRSYVVNMKFIEKVDSRKVTLRNGLEIAIGRTRSNEFKKAFFKWRMLFDN